MKYHQKDIVEVNFLFPDIPSILILYLTIW